MLREADFGFHHSPDIMIEHAQRSMLAEQLGFNEQQLVFLVQQEKTIEYLRSRITDLQHKDSRKRGTLSRLAPVTVIDLPPSPSATAPQYADILGGNTLVAELSPAANVPPQEDILPRNDFPTTVTADVEAPSHVINVDVSTLQRRWNKSRISPTSSSEASYDSMEDDMSETDSNESGLSRNTIDKANAAIEEEAYRETKRLMAPPVDDDLFEPDVSTSDGEKSEDELSISAVPFVVKGHDPFGNAEVREYTLQLDNKQVRKYTRWAELQGREERREADNKVRKPIARTPLRRRPPEKFLLPAYITLWDFCDKLQQKHVGTRMEAVKLKRKLSKLSEIPVVPEFMLQDGKAGLYGLEYEHRKLKKQNDYLKKELKRLRWSSAPNEQEVRQVLVDVKDRMGKFAAAEYNLLLNKSLNLQQRYEEEVRDLGRQVEGVKERTVELELRNVKLERELKRSDVELSAVSSEKTTLEKTIATLRENYGEMRQEMVNLEARYKTFVATYGGILAGHSKSLPKTIHKLESECRQLKQQRDQAMHTAKFGLYSTNQMVRTQSRRSNNARLSSEARLRSEKNSEVRTLSESPNVSAFAVKDRRGRQSVRSPPDLPAPILDNVAQHSNQTLAERVDLGSLHIALPPENAESDLDLTRSMSLAQVLPSPKLRMPRSSPLKEVKSKEHEPHQHVTIDVDWIFAELDDSNHGRPQPVDTMRAKVLFDLVGFGKGGATRNFKKDDIIFAHTQTQPQFCIVQLDRDPASERYVLLRNDIGYICSHNTLYEKAPYIVKEDFLAKDGLTHLRAGYAVYCTPSGNCEAASSDLETEMSVVANVEAVSATRRCAMTMSGLNQFWVPAEYIFPEPCTRPLVHYPRPPVTISFSKTALVLCDCIVYHDAEETSEAFSLFEHDHVLVADIDLERKHILFVKSMGRGESGFVDNSFLQVHDQVLSDPSDENPNALFPLLSPRPIFNVPMNTSYLGSESPVKGKPVLIEGKDNYNLAGISEEAREAWAQNRPGSKPALKEWDDAVGLYRHDRVFTDWTSGLPAEQGYILRTDFHKLPERLRSALNVNPVGPRRPITCKSRVRSKSEPPEPKADEFEKDFEKQKYIIKHVNVGLQRQKVIGDSDREEGYNSDCVTKQKKEKKRTLYFEPATDGWQVSRAGTDAFDPYYRTHLPLFRNGNSKFKSRRRLDDFGLATMLRLVNKHSIWAGVHKPRRLDPPVCGNIEELFAVLTSYKNWLPALRFNVHISPDRHHEMGRFQIGVFSHSDINGRAPSDVEVSIKRPVCQESTLQIMDEFTSQIKDVVVTEPFCRTARFSEHKQPLILLGTYGGDDSDWCLCMVDGVLQDLPASELKLEPPSRWLPYHSIKPELDLASTALKLEEIMRDSTQWDEYFQTTRAAEETGEGWLHVGAGAMLRIEEAHAGAAGPIVCSLDTDPEYRGFVMAHHIDLDTPWFPLFRDKSTEDMWLEDNNVVVLKVHEDKILLYQHGKKEWNDLCIVQESYQWSGWYARLECVEGDWRWVFTQPPTAEGDESHLMSEISPRSNVSSGDSSKPRSANRSSSDTVASTAPTSASIIISPTRDGEFVETKSQPIPQTNSKRSSSATPPTLAFAIDFPTKDDAFLEHKSQRVSVTESNGGSSSSLSLNSTSSRPKRRKSKTRKKSFSDKLQERAVGPVSELFPQSTRVNDVAEVVEQAMPISTTNTTSQSTRSSLATGLPTFVSSQEDPVPVNQNMSSPPSQSRIQSSSTETTPLESIFSGRSSRQSSRQSSASSLSAQASVLSEDSPKRVKSKRLSVPQLATVPEHTHQAGDGQGNRDMEEQVIPTTEYKDLPTAPEDTHQADDGQGNGVPEEQVIPTTEYKNLPTAREDPQQSNAERDIHDTEAQESPATDYSHPSSVHPPLAFAHKSSASRHNSAHSINTGKIIPASKSVSSTRSSVSFSMDKGLEFSVADGSAEDLRVCQSMLLQYERLLMIQSGRLDKLPQQPRPNSR